MKKYKLLKEEIIDGLSLHRIEALRDFGDVKAGDLGGYISSEDNLSHDGDCWVFGSARVYGSAEVYGEARVSGSARVYGEALVSGEARVSGKALVSGKARVSGNARVYGSTWVSDTALVYGEALVDGSARVYGYAQVYDNARVSGKAEVYGSAWVSGSAQVYDNAQVYGEALVLGNARVFDEAWVYGEARVSGSAQVYGSAEVHQDMWLTTGECSSDLTEDLEANIKLQIGLDVVDGKIECWKYVNEDLSSWYDSSFKYEVGAWAEVLDYDKSDESCVAGLHVSNKEYWQDHCFPVLLRCYVDIDDIIAVQMGKIRCKKLYVVEICK